MIPAPQLAPLFSLFVDLGEPREMGEHPSGRRRIIPVIGGRVEGKRVSGNILNVGADWQVVWADGTAKLDTRYAFETHDGAVVEIVNFGYRHGPADVLAALARGEDVDPSLYSMRTHARFETGDARYGWLNRTLAVGSGRRLAKQVQIDLLEIL